MARTNFNDLAAFAVVARERSFTKAGEKLGVTSSAVSHMMRGLEDRLGVRLLLRTTRSVAPTAEGDRLLLALEPRIGEIEAALASLGERRDGPAGTVKLATDETCLQHRLWPSLHRVLSSYPHINLEVAIDPASTDIVAGYYDGVVRLGLAVEPDVVSVPIGPSEQRVVVGAPSYFASRRAPQTPADLLHHDCIQRRLEPSGDLERWQFDNGGERVDVKASGRLTFNALAPILTAALFGHGLADLPEAVAKAYIQDGRLQTVLNDWRPPLGAYHLCYSGRRPPTPAFSTVIEALRFQAADEA